MARKFPRRTRSHASTRSTTGANSPTSSHRSSARIRTSVIGAFALAGVFLLAADQVPGSHRNGLFGKALRKTNAPGTSRRLSVNDYEKVLHRALASTSTDEMPKEALDHEKIARRALAEASSSSPSSRSLTSDNVNYDIIKEAQKIRDADNDNAVPFVFVMQATVGMIPMIKSWICNTATMDGVHSNTLLIVDEAGKKLLDDFEPAKDMHIVLDSLPKEMHGSWDFGTLGYWLATVRIVFTPFWT